MHPRNEQSNRLHFPSATRSLATTGLTKRLTCWVFIACLLAFSLSALLGYPNQRRVPPPKSKPQDRTLKGQPAEQDGSPEPKGATFGVDVNLVVLNTTVLDRKTGRFIEGLQKGDFTVYEDRVQQVINSFTREDLPITLGILIDTSGSMRKKIDPVTKAALLFVQSSNPNDEVFLISFNTEATLVEDFTSEIPDLRDSLDNLMVGGGTALYDAIYLGVKKAQQGHKQKRALIVITDGDDRDSQYKFEETLEKIREADVQVYSIGFLDPEEDRGLFEGIFKKSRQRKAQDVLQKFSEETGGKAVFPKDIVEIDQIVKDIAQELRNQYTIGYVSSNQTKDGSWRLVRVALNRPDASKYKVRARSGYNAPKK